MAKNRKRRVPSKKGHPKPVEPWQLALGAGAVVLMFLLWALIRNYQ